MADLKPCPFCRREPKVFLRSARICKDSSNAYRAAVEHVIECPSCFVSKAWYSQVAIDACGELKLQENGYEEAARLWNRRNGDE